MKIFLFFILSVFWINFNAQTIEITGQIKDELSKKPLEFVNVVVFNQKDSLIVRSITDENGYFKIPIEKGQYKFIFNFFGYENDTTELYFLNESKFIDVFKLTPTETMLEGVTIEGESYHLKIDKDVKVVTEEMKTGAANTYDVLDKISGLHYDRYNDQITVDNDKNVIIIVNGIEKDADYIKNLDPDRILKVEIIHDPSGKYALEGYSSVINVILKTNYKGSDIFLSVFSIAMPFQEHIHKLPIGNTYLSTNFTQKKLNFYANYANYMGVFDVKTIKNQFYSDTFSIEYNLPENTHYNHQMYYQKHNFNTGIDFYLNPKHTISYETSYNLGNMNRNNSRTNYIISTIINGTEINNIESSIYNANDSRTYNNSLFYVGNFNEKNSLNLSYTFSIYNSNNENIYTQDDIATLQNGKDEKTFSNFNTEFTHSFNSKLNVNFGYGNIYKLLNNFYTYNYGSADETNKNFKQQETRNQFYGYFSYQPIDLLGFKFGLAAENSVFEYEQNKMPYFIYLPHVDIHLKFKEFVDFRIKYRSNSNYPSISQTNPFTQIVDWQTVSTGNPDLKPEKVNKLSANLSILTGLITIEPYYNFSNNNIIQVINLMPDGKWQITYDNAAIRKDIGINTGITVPLGPIIFQNNATFFKDKIEYNNETYDVKDWIMSSKLLYSNKKTNTLFGVIYQNQLRKAITWKGYWSWGNDFWCLFFQQALFKQKFNIMLIYALPIEWGAEFNQNTYLITSEYEEFNNVDLSIIKNMILFNISYRFTKGKEIKKIDKNVDIEQENQQQKFF